MVCKASILDWLKSPLAKVDLSAKFGVVVCKASILDWLRESISQSRVMSAKFWCSGIQGIYSRLTWEDPLANVGSSAKFGDKVVVMQGIYSWLTEESIGQSRFVCQVWCSGIQGIFSQLTGGPLSQSRVICQVLCTGIQVISPLLYLGGSISQSRFICQVWCSGIQGIYS